MRRYCRISTLLDVRLIVAQQRSRQALTSQEMNESQAAIKLFKEQQKDLENCWKQTRWAYDMISAARSRTSECGLKLGSILSCEHPRIEDDCEVNSVEDPIYAVPYLDENSPQPPISQFIQQQQQQQQQQQSVDQRRPSTASSERRPSSTASSHQRGPSKESWTPIAFAAPSSSPSGSDLHSQSRSSAHSRSGLHHQSSYNSPSPPINFTVPTTPTSPYNDGNDSNLASRPNSGPGLHPGPSTSSQPTTPTTPYIDDCDPIVAASPNLAPFSSSMLTDSVNVELQPVTLNFPQPSTPSLQQPNGHLLEGATQHLQLTPSSGHHPEDHIQLSPVQKQHHHLPQQQPHCSPVQQRKRQSQFQITSHPRLPIASSPICPLRLSGNATPATANESDLSSSPPRFFFPPPPSTSPTASVISRTTKDMPDGVRSFNADDSLRVSRVLTEKYGIELNNLEKLCCDIIVSYFGVPRDKKGHSQKNMSAYFCLLINVEV